jgi:hypothetical protein
MSHEKVARRLSWRGKEGEVTLVEEHTTNGYEHALSLADLQAFLAAMPSDDLVGLSAIILHQPSRRDDAMHPRWAAYFPEFHEDGIAGPAIVLEAIDCSTPIRWSTSLNPDDQRELALLEKEGHGIERTPRQFLISLDRTAVRNTQRRSFLHELGHHVDFMKDPITFRRSTKTQKESSATRYARDNASWLDAT